MLSHNEKKKVVDSRNLSSQWGRGGSGGKGCIFIGIVYIAQYSSKLNGGKVVRMGLDEVIDGEKRKRRDGRREMSLCRESNENGQGQD